MSFKVCWIWRSCYKSSKSGYEKSKHTFVTSSNLILWMYGLKKWKNLGTWTTVMLLICCKYMVFIFAWHDLHWCDIDTPHSRMMKTAGECIHWPTRVCARNHPYQWFMHKQWNVTLIESARLMVERISLVVFLLYYYYHIIISWFL